MHSSQRRPTKARAPKSPPPKPRDNMPAPLSNPHNYQTNGLKKNRNFTPI